MRIRVYNILCKTPANQSCRFGAIIPNIEAAKKLGYKMGENSHMGGKVYERLTDACSFGLLEKARGGLKATYLAKQALDPYDISVANKGKAKALRTISILDKAFNVWIGTLPTVNALSVRIAEIT